MSQMSHKIEVNVDKDVIDFLPLVNNFSLYTQIRDFLATVKGRASESDFRLSISQITQIYTMRNEKEQTNP